MWLTAHSVDRFQGQLTNFHAPSSMTASSRSPDSKRIRQRTRLKLATMFGSSVPIAVYGKQFQVAQLQTFGAKRSWPNWTRCWT